MDRRDGGRREKGRKGGREGGKEGRREGGEGGREGGRKEKKEIPAPLLRAGIVPQIHSTSITLRWVPTFPLTLLPMFPSMSLLHCALYS